MDDGRRQLSYAQLLELTKTYRPTFKELSKKWKVPKFKRIALPNTTLYPKSWTYLVSNEKRPHTITPEELRAKGVKQGDKVYFERGQVYNWLEYEVTTDSNTIGAFGSGADPKFIGSTSLTAATWTSETGGYYSTPLATAPLWVTKDGEMARQGESAWIPITSAPSGTERGFLTATLNAFNAVESLTTAKARGKEFQFRMSYELTISSYNTGTGVVTFGSSLTGFTTNLPMKFYGQKQFATLEGDWWWDAANNELWIKTASDPTGTDIRVVTERYAFSIDEAENCTIQGLEFTQYYDEAIETFRATGLDIDDLYIHDIRTNGLAMFGNNTGTLDVGNCVIERCGLNAVSIGAISNTTFHDLEIDSIGLQDNIGWPIHAEYRKHGGTAISVNDEQTEVTHLPDTITVQNCLLTNLGYQGVAPYGDNWLIENVHIKDYCQKFTDGGGVHTFYSSNLGTGSCSDGIIRNVIAEGGVGSRDGIAGSTEPGFAMGFYIDNGSNNWLIEDSVSFNNSFAGVHVNWDTEQTTIDGCLIARNGVVTSQHGAQIFFWDKPNVTDSPNFTRNKKNVVTNNIIVTPTDQQLAIVTISTSTGADANYNPFDTGGSCDNNRYVKIYKTQFSSLFGHNVLGIIDTYTPLTFASWQSRNSCDASSTVMTPYIDYGNTGRITFDIRVLTNPTSAPVNVAVPSNFQDEDNADLVSPISVPAWGARLVLTKASNYYLTDGFNEANGTSLAGRTPTIGPIPTIVAGTHTFSGSNLISSVDGHTRYDLGSPDLIWEMRQSASINNNSFLINFRAQDNTTSANNRIIFTKGATQLEVSQVVGGVSTSLATFSQTTTAGVQYVFKIILNGSSVRVFVDDVERITTTTALLTGNFHGIFGSTTKTTYYYIAYPLTSVV